MHRMQIDPLNETLVIQARVSQNEYFFVVDTGYAGPLVLNTSYLALKRDTKQNKNDVKLSYLSDLEEIKNVTENERNKSANALLNSHFCLAYTSGCTMRLMGIGETLETQADMLMCEMLAMKTRRGCYSQPKRNSTPNVHADVYVTNHFPSCVHIMTCDFLMHSSPALLSIRKEQLSLHLSIEETIFLKKTMKLYPGNLSGGAFTIDVTIAGEPFRCTMDTGSPTPISLGKEAARRIPSCKRKKKTLSQNGVNGEGICSEVITSSMTICDRLYENVPIFVNDHNVDQTDGYIGLSVLRAFDILILVNEFGLRPNGLSMVSAESLVDETNDGTCNIDLPHCQFEKNDESVNRNENY